MNLIDGLKREIEARRLHRVAMDAQREGLTRLADKLMERDGIQSIILAGTDLALVFNENNTDFPHVDAARVHLSAIMLRALDQP